MQNLTTVGPDDYNKLVSTKQSSNFESRKDDPAFVAKWIEGYSLMSGLSKETIADMLKANSYEEFAVPNGSNVTNIQILTYVTALAQAFEVDREAQKTWRDGISHEMSLLNAKLSEVIQYLQELDEIKVKSAAIEDEQKRMGISSTKERHPHKSRYNKQWTEEELEFLKNNMHWKTATLSSKLHRTKSAIDSMRYKLRANKEV